MWETAALVETSAPPDAVWALWEDPARWREWNRDIVSTRPLGPFARGEKARVRLKRSIPMIFTITALEPGRLFTDETRLPGARMGHEHVVERRGDRTVIGNRLYFDGPLASLWGRLMGRRMRASVASFVELEKRLAEAA